MAMIGYLGGAEARRRNYFLTECECKIHLDDKRAPIIETNQDTIKGKICFYHLIRGKPLEFRDLRIQLEAIVTTRFRTKFDGRVTNQFTDDRFLPEDSTPDSYLVHHFIREGKPTNEAYEIKTKGTTKVRHSFPFELKLNGECLPQTFETGYGRIQYKLVVYGGISLEFSELIAAEKYLTTKGSFNLSTDSSLSKPLTVTRKKQKSMFSTRPTLKANLMLKRKGFLSGEDLPFKFHVENANCENISRLNVQFVQKIIYFANKANKPTAAVLESQDFSCESTDNEIHWEGSIGIPENLMPSFSKKKKSIEILYFLQFTVELIDKVGLKGETTITIGTTRDEGDETEESVTSSSRRSSVDSTWDTISVQTCSTLPPSYSKLSSRRPSLETLPPTYDEVEEASQNWDEEESGTRPRRNSNVILKMVKHTRSEDKTSMVTRQMKKNKKLMKIQEAEIKRKEGHDRNTRMMAAKKELIRREETVKEELMIFHDPVIIVANSPEFRMHHEGIHLYLACLGLVRCQEPI